MATVRDMMVDSLAKASKAAEQITSSVERAHAFSELAEACASALAVKGAESAEVDSKKTEAEEAEVKEEKQEEKKEEKKPTKKRATKKKEPEPEPEEDEEESEELTEEWTTYAMEALADEVAKFEGYCEQFDDEVINGMISDATEGVAKDRNDVTPLNIKLILDYIHQLEEAAENEEEEE